MYKIPSKNDTFSSTNTTIHKHMMTNHIFEHLFLYSDVICW